MEQIVWPDNDMRVTFLTEGPQTPLPPPDRTQDTYRLPPGTRVVELSGWLGFVVAHDDYPPKWINVDGSVKYAPLEHVWPLIEARANTMTGSDVLRFGAFTRNHEG